MSMIIRASRAQDVPQITAIYRPAVLHGTASFEIDPPDEAEMARRRRLITDAGFPYLVAEEAGRLLGYCYAGPYRPRQAYRFAVEDSIYIAPEAQGRGVGRALLSALVTQCEAMGFRQIVAVIGDSASAGSIGLHRSCGFVDGGRMRSVGFKHGRWLDQVLMQRPLGPGDATPPVEREP
jgi:L-amino acid N-acyltransferase YncA